MLPLTTERIFSAGAANLIFPNEILNDDSLPDAIVNSLLNETVASGYPFGSIRKRYFPASLTDMLKKPSLSVFAQLLDQSQRLSAAMYFCTFIFTHWLFPGTTAVPL